jgi:hypothetical protein
LSKSYLITSTQTLYIEALEEIFTCELFFHILMETAITNTLHERLHHYGLNNKRDTLVDGVVFEGSAIRSFVRSDL